VKSGTGQADEREKGHWRINQSIEKWFSSIFLSTAKKRPNDCFRGGKKDITITFFFTSIEELERKITTLDLFQWLR